MANIAITLMTHNYISLFHRTTPEKVQRLGLEQGCQTYGPRAGSGPLDGLIRPGLDPRAIAIREWSACNRAASQTRPCWLADQLAPGRIVVMNWNQQSRPAPPPPPVNNRDQHIFDWSGPLQIWPLNQNEFDTPGLEGYGRGCQATCR